VQTPIPTPPYTEEEWRKAEGLVMSALTQWYPLSTFRQARWPIMNAIVVYVAQVRYEFYMHDLVRGKIFV
jgi:hypothetical protein